MSSNAPTIRFVIFDILGDLKQLYDDAQLSPFKIWFWICIFADRLKKQHVEKLDSGAYVTRFVDVAVTIDPITGRNRFQLPKAIYDFEGDGAIDYVTYSYENDLSLPMFSSVSFTRTTPSKAARLYFREDEKPTPANPYFYRQGDYIYLLGTEEINILKIEVGLKCSLGPVDTSIDIDQPFDFPQDLLPVLKRQLLDIGRFALMVPADRINDGAEWESKNFPTQKIVSVNDPDTTNAERYQQQQYNQ